LKTYLEEPRFAVLDAVDWDELTFVVDSPQPIDNCGFYQPRRWSFRTGIEQTEQQRAA
jgi:hypothetical protein